MIDVIALGELLIDFACVSVDEFGYPQMAAHPGGAPANYLASLAKFGMSTAMIGKVGNDVFGELLIGTLKRCGINVEGIVLDDNVFTTLAFVTFDEQNDRHFSFSRKPGADTMLKTEEVAFSLIDEAKVLHFGTLSLTDEPSATATRSAISYAKEKRLLISYDPNLRMPLWRSEMEARREILWGLSQADIVKISDNEVDFLWHISPFEGAEKIIQEYGVKTVFVTCGKDGCCYSNPFCIGRAKSKVAVQAVDTTGAGDIFGGSAMYQILKKRKKPEDLTDTELHDIAEFACTSATLSTTRPGGIQSVYDLDTILQEYKK